MNNEEINLSLGAKIRMLRTYLGQFYVTVPVEIRKLLHAKIPQKGLTVYVESDIEFLKQVAAWYLLKWGEQAHVVETTYDVLNRFLGISDSDEDSKLPFANTTTSLLILMHMEYTVPNKRLPDVIAHTVENRQLVGKPTLVLSQVYSDMLYDFFIGRDNTVCIRTKSVKRRFLSAIGGNDGSISRSGSVSEAGVTIEKVKPVQGA